MSTETAFAEMRAALLASSRTLIVVQCNKCQSVTKLRQ